MSQYGISNLLTISSIKKSVVYLGTVAAFTALTLSSTVNAKAINPGDFEQVSTPFRGDDQEAARKKVIRAMKKASRTERTKIVVLPFSDKDVPGLYKIGGGKAAERALKAQLNSSGVQIIDRDLPKSLEAELIAIEQSGQSLGASYDLAEYAFKGSVLDVEKSAQWTPRKWVTNRDGDGYWRASSCNMKATAVVNLQFYNMNPLSLEKTVVLKETSYAEVENVRSCRQSSTVDVNGVVIDSIKKTVEKKIGTIRNLFAAKGMITEHRAKGKYHIFRTSLKRTAGTSAKTSVVVFKTKKITDPITGEVNEVKSKIASGKVQDVYGDNNVWIKVKKKYAKKILLGDMVEVLQKDKCGLDPTCWKDRVM